MGSGEDDPQDVGVRRTRARSPASVSMVNIVLTPPQRPLRASLTASAAILDPVSTGLEALTGSLLIRAKAADRTPGETDSWSSSSVFMGIARAYRERL